MGLTVHYRGSLDDLSRVEEFEDCVVQFVFAVGGKPTIWRSFADGNPERVIRGVMVDLAQGVDTLSLLVSPEGHFIPLFQIEDAESNPLDEPPYCFVKTQFGSTISHVSVVLLLDAIGNRFATNMAITDEGGFYETRDFPSLRHKQLLLADAIKDLGSQLSTTSLSREAAEDPEIIARRIERIAMLVHQEFSAERRHALDVPAADEPAPTGNASPADETGMETSLEEEVERFERYRRKDDLRNERMARRITESMAAGKSPSEAIDEAMRAEGLDGPGRRQSTIDEDESEYASQHEFDQEAVSEWRASFPEGTWLESDELTANSRHAAVEAASHFLQQLSRLRVKGTVADNFVEVANRGAMDFLGGLVQATSRNANDRIDRALTISQLRRALSGHAFARGAIFALRSENAIELAEGERLFEQLETILDHIHDLAAAAWDE